VVQPDDARLETKMQVHGIKRVPTLSVANFGRFEGFVALHAAKAQLRA
jgi:hypothetical protein